MIFWKLNFTNIECIGMQLNQFKIYNWILNGIQIQSKFNYEKAHASLPFHIHVSELRKEWYSYAWNFLHNVFIIKLTTILLDSILILLMLASSIKEFWIFFEKMLPSTFRQQKSENKTLVGGIALVSIFFISQKWLNMLQKQSFSKAFFGSFGVWNSVNSPPKKHWVHHRFTYLWGGRWCSDHPQEDFAKFGYRSTGQKEEIENFRNLWTWLKYFWVFQWPESGKKGKIKKFLYLPPYSSRN